LDATPQRDRKRTESTRFTHTSTVASPQAGPRAPRCGAPPILAATLRAGTSFGL